VNEKDGLLLLLLLLTLSTYNPDGV